MMGTIYKGKILDQYAYNGTSKDGRKQIRREVIGHRRAAAILAFDKSSNIVMITQERFPHGTILEIPAGILEKGEEPIECAFRELAEETGYTAKNMTPMISYYPSIGYNTEHIHCFMATDLEKDASGATLDEDEIISVVKMTPQEVISKIMSGEIKDSKTICAIMAWMVSKKD